MTGLMKRIFRRREPGQQPRRGVATLFRRRARGPSLPGYQRGPSFRIPARLKRLPWKPAPPPPAPPPPGETQEANVVAEPLPPSFKDRGRLRRRLRFLRRARELGFRDIGGLIFDMRRFRRSRPDLLDAKLDALLAVDQEVRSLERILDDRRPFHELREPGISACARCGALHSSEANFCPHCGMQFIGPRAMGEVGGAIAAPPQAPPAPGAVEAQTPRPAVAQEWPWPDHGHGEDQPTAPTVPAPPAAPKPDPLTEQLTVAYVPVLQEDPPRDPEEDAAADEAEQPTADGTGPEPPVAEPPDPPVEQPEPSKPATKKPRAARKSAKRTPADEQETETHLPPQASGGS